MMKTIKYGGVLSLLAVATAASAQEIKVTVDNEPVRFGLAKPITQDGRVLVPLRGVFEQMGAFVQWNPASKMIDAQKGTTQVRLTLGQNYATVNGTEVKMDTPPQIINGSTMVPLRFLSESLGANVSWKATQRLVAILSTDNPNDVNYKPTDPDGDTVQVRRVVDAFTVIPVKLTTEVSSQTARAGDLVMATIDTRGSNDYAGIPAGSKLEGRVLEAKRQSGDDPGMLELDFERIVLPNGKKFAIDGTLYSLDQKQISEDDQGVLKAKDKSKNNRVVYAGYGAGAGVLVGLLQNGKLDLGKALIGALIGFGIGSAEKSERRPADVTLKAGTDVGVRLNQSVALRI